MHHYEEGQFSIIVFLRRFYNRVVSRKVRIRLEIEIEIGLDFD